MISLWSASCKDSPSSTFPPGNSYLKEVYENLAEKEVYENMYFYLDILIDLLDRADDKDELIHYLKIKGHLGKWTINYR